MGLADYQKTRRKAAIRRSIFTLVILVVGWVVFLKIILLSGETKLRNAKIAKAKDNWEEVDYQNYKARRLYAFYLKLFETLPTQLSIEKIDKVKKSHRQAIAGLAAVNKHNRDIERKNEEIRKKKEKTKQDYLERLKKGEIAVAGEEYPGAEPVTNKEDIQAAVVTREKDKRPEDNQGKWLEDIKGFDEAEDESSSAIAPPQTDLTPERKEGVVESSKPSWFNK